MNKTFAYAAVAMDASESTYVTTSREQAEACCRENGWQLVPLYAGQWLTEAERAAVAFAYKRMLSSYVEEREVALTLRGLLERTRESHTTQETGSDP